LLPETWTQKTIAMAIKKGKGKAELNTVAGGKLWGDDGR
jgi:hypothetical protein